VLVCKGYRPLDHLAPNGRKDRQQDVGHGSGFVQHRNGEGINRSMTSCGVPVALPFSVSSYSHLSPWRDVHPAGGFYL
jgi:hypothetical protein